MALVAWRPRDEQNAAMDVFRMQASSACAAGLQQQKPKHPGTHAGVLKSSCGMPGYT